MLLGSPTLAASQYGEKEAEAETIVFMFVFMFVNMLANDHVEGGKDIFIFVRQPPSTDVSLAENVQYYGIFAI
jgi:hypothetical protein